MLRNVATREEQECHVVFLGAMHDGKSEVGIEFKRLAPNGFDEATRAQTLTAQSLALRRGLTAPTGFH